MKFLSKRSCLKTSEFMPAASLASLTEFKVSNSEKSEITKKAEISGKSRNFRKNLKFRKDLKF